MPFKIEKLTAFIAVEDQEEGVMAALVGDVYIPLVCADEARVASLYELAQHISERKGIPFKVIQFDNRQDVTEETNNKYGKERTNY